jgi:hypothetical protein
MIDRYLERIETLLYLRTISALSQHSRHVNMAILLRKGNCKLPVQIRCPPISTMIQKQAYQMLIAILSGIVQRRTARYIFITRIRAMVQENFRRRVDAAKL